MADPSKDNVLRVGTKVKLHGSPVAEYEVVWHGIQQHGIWYGFRDTMFGGVTYGYREVVRDVLQPGEAARKPAGEEGG